MAKENFEESMKKLETIVTELENGNLNLDESVKKFEEGMKVAKQCNNILEDAEKKITILLEENGELKEEEFETE
ncbi:exodeoxyribonuclease 7 small subunit [Clostridium sp. CAG:356]|nr:exodeoxyribonuclease 7 small subunit [Clostridium sp. CAG:356]